jgi:hypothetical protein
VERGKTEEVKKKIFGPNKRWLYPHVLPMEKNTKQKIL